MKIFFVFAICWLFLVCNCGLFRLKSNAHRIHVVKKNVFHKVTKLLNTSPKFDDRHTIGEFYIRWFWHSPPSEQISSVYQHVCFFILANNSILSSSTTNALLFGLIEWLKTKDPYFFLPRNIYIKINPLLEPFILFVTKLNMISHNNETTILFIFSCLFSALLFPLYEQLGIDRKAYFHQREISVRNRQREKLNVNSTSRTGHLIR